jgi:GrpB-like predicted nucleotidyltransferase (UPF0157 family)
MPVELKPSNSTRLEQYELEKEVIKRALGTVVSKIAHIGSTSLDQLLPTAGRIAKKQF